MLKTRVCDILGIQYPIVQSPMNWISCAELVAAVSNAGGLGIMGPNAGADRPTPDPKAVKERVRGQIRETKRLTNKPFGINLEPGSGGGNPFTEAYLEAALEEKVPIIYSSAGSPAIYTKLLHDNGVKVLHIVASVRHARKAEEVGVDVIVVGGMEAGGMSSGSDQIPLLDLLPQVVDAVKTPVIAGCGIADARGFVAARLMGAEGIAMGTRFMVTQESRLHPAVKQALVDAGDTDTLLWGRKMTMQRSLKNKFTQKYLEMELGGATPEQLRALMADYKDPSGKSLSRTPGATLGGDLDWGIAHTGAIAGLVKEIKSAEEVIRDIVSGVDEVLARLKGERVTARR